MQLDTINSYINPFSNGFQCTADKFSNLNSSQKAITVCLTILASVATLLCGCIGGFAAFKAIVDRYNVKVLEEGENKTANKTKKVADKELNLEEQTEVNPAGNGDCVSLVKLLQTAKMPLSVPSPYLGLTEENVKDIQKGFNEEDSKLYLAILPQLRSVISENKSSGLEKAIRALLAPFIEQPVRYLSVLSTILFLLKQEKVSLSSINQLLEQLEWPHEEIKKEQITLLMKRIIHLDGGIYFGDWKSGAVKKAGGSAKTELFPCYKASLNTKKVFGHGVFRGDEPWMTENFVTSIGTALIETGNRSVEALKQNIGDSKKQMVGLQLDIGEFVETKFSAALIAPLLPYLKDVPGLVSLDLSDIGVDHNKDGFGDEHADGLLNLVLSQPYLLNFTANTKGMSEGIEKKFWENVTSILEARKDLYPIDPVRFLEIIAPPKIPLMIYSTGKKDTYSVSV